MSPAVSIGRVLDPRKNVANQLMYSFKQSIIYFAKERFKLLKNLSAKGSEIIKAITNPPTQRYQTAKN